jgi:polyisoprenoid-binding protein YceI
MTTYNWQFDAAHSEIGFIVKHMMFAKVRGSFADWSGEFRFDPADPANTFVRATIDASTIDTGNGQRDDHLRSPDFFNVEEFPEITFESTGWTPNHDGYDVTGNLTIRGVTKPMTLEVVNNGRATDPWGNTRMGLSVRTSVNRKEFGLNWNQALEAGGVLVGDEVKVEIEVQAIQAEQIQVSAA